MTLQHLATTALTTQTSSFAETDLCRENRPYWTHRQKLPPPHDLQFLRAVISGDST